MYNIPAYVQLHRYFNVDWMNRTFDREFRRAGCIAIFAHINRCLSIFSKWDPTKYILIVLIAVYAGSFI